VPLRRIPSTEGSWDAIYKRRDVNILLMGSSYRNDSSRSRLCATCRVPQAALIYLLHHDLESLSDAATWRLRKRHYFTDFKFGFLDELVQPWWDSLQRYSSTRCQIFRETLTAASLHEAIHSLKLAQTSLISTLWGFGSAIEAYLRFPVL
jgi:hypothetical protein